jgi:hypothetical protein
MIYPKIMKCFQYHYFDLENLKRRRLEIFNYLFLNGKCELLFLITVGIFHCECDCVEAVRVRDYIFPAESNNEVQRTNIEEIK